MNQLQKLVSDNLSAILNILKPYKHQRIQKNIQMNLQDFIQLFSRLQFLETKIQQLFKMCDNLRKQGNQILKSQHNILKEKNEIMIEYQQIERMFNQPTQIDTIKNDISQLCGEAYKNLLENQSFDLSKLSGIRETNYIQNQGGEWDSKLESECEKSSELEQVKKAFQLLDRAHMFEPKNLEMLMKCAENTDKQIYLDFFLQIMNLQNKTTKSTKSPELREQVLQVPVCQEFSFESPLPSLREQHQQPLFNHVNLEDLLLIQDRMITEEQSPQKCFSKKPKIDGGSFYSQQNVKNLLGKDGVTNILKRDRTPSDHIPRSNSTHSVENQIQSTRQQCFKRKISQPSSITERTYNQ